MEQFVTTLRDQANKCKFGELKDSLIKSMITCGVNSTEIREKLLQNDEASLEEASKICNAIYEDKEQSTKMANGNGNSVETEYIQAGQRRGHKPRDWRSRPFIGNCRNEPSQLRLYEYLQEQVKIQRQAAEQERKNIRYSNHKRMP